MESDSFRTLGQPLRILPQIKPRSELSFQGDDLPVVLHALKSWRSGFRFHACRSLNSSFTTAVFVFRSLVCGSIPTSRSADLKEYSSATRIRIMSRRIVKSLSAHQPRSSCKPGSAGARWNTYL